MQSLARGIARQLSAPIRSAYTSCAAGSGRPVTGLLLKSSHPWRGFHGTAPAFVKFTQEDRRRLRNLFREIGFEDGDMLDVPKGDKKKEEGEGYDLSKVTLREEDGSLTPMGSFVLDKLDKWEKTPAGRRKLDRLESEWRAELKDAFKGIEGMEPFVPLSVNPLNNKDDDEDGYDVDDGPMKKPRAGKDGEEQLDEEDDPMEFDDMEDSDVEDEDISMEDLIPSHLQFRVISIQRVVNQTGGGKVESFAGMVAVGNCDGLAAYARCKSYEPNKALLIALRKAIRKLQFIPRFNNHTICHDLYVKFRQTRLYMRPRPKGHGVVAHDILQELCHLAGISDLSANVVGNTHKLNMIKAFFQALNSQRMIEDIAEARGRNIVTWRKAVKVSG